MSAEATSENWVARKLAGIEFRIHGLTERVRNWMDNRRDPRFGPSDYVDEEAENRLVRALAQAIRIGTYNEGGGGPQWQQKVILAVTSGLLLAGICGGIVMYGEMKVIEANQNNSAKQMTEWKQDQQQQNLEIHQQISELRGEIRSRAP